MAQVSYGTITITDTTDIDSIKNWYLATSASSGVTKITTGWTDTIQQMTESKQYLWNYEQILGTGGVEISSTQPVIIGRYGKDGTEGNSITSIDEYYQITNSTSNPGSSGWSKNTLVVPTSTNKYLWNYQVIHYSKTADEGSYSDARIIGVYGDKGERGTSILKVTTQPTTASGTAGGFSYSYRIPLSTVINESGKTEVLKGDIIEYNSNHYQVGYVNSSYVYLGPVTSIKGADSTQYYVFIRYSANSSGSGYVTTPTSSTKYIGVYMGTSSSPPAYDNNGWTWSEYVGADGASVTSVRELYWLKTNSTNPSQITWNSSTSQPSQTIYSTDRTNSWTSIVPTYVANGTYYTCIETSLSNNTKVWSAPVQNIALTDANSNAANALEKSTLAIGQVTNLDNRLKAFFWPGDSSYSGAFAVAKTSDDGLDVSNANTYGFNTRVATGLVSIGYDKIPLSEWGINEGLKMYYPILDNGIVVDNKLGMQLTTDALDLYNPTLSYKIYEDTIGNPQELRLYEYSNLDNTYILTQDTTFLSNKTYYENDIIKGLEITAEGIDLYNPSGKKGLEITSNGIDIFGENETKGLSMQSGGLVIYDPSETSSDSISLIAVQQTGFSLGYDADTLEGLDPYTTAIAEPFIVWQKAEDNEQDAHNRLYVYTDDIILRINDNSPSTQQLFLKDKLSQIDDNILANNQAINTNKQKIQKNENEISVNTQNIILNKENISKNTTNITLINNKLIKIKAYWTIDNNNHLTLVEEVLNG